MKICVLGASGMLGHMLFSELLHFDYDVYGTVRSPQAVPQKLSGRMRAGVNVLDTQTVRHALDAIAPDVVINAVGLIRHLPEGREPLPCIQVNAAFPHLLWEACGQRGIRCINYSTDCVFNGKAGRPYLESDKVTADDVYGLTKYLGEIAGPLALTIRTSIIGPELREKISLLEWFLEQKGTVRGFTGAIYTGLPTSEHARILVEYVLPNKTLEGLFQVSGEPISKYDLLRTIAKIYKKDIDITPDASVQEDKRLSGALFHVKTGYLAPTWDMLVADMYAAHERTKKYWL